MRYVRHCNHCPSVAVHRRPGARFPVFGSESHRPSTNFPPFYVGACMVHRRRARSQTGHLMLSSCSILQSSLRVTWGAASHPTRHGWGRRSALPCVLRKWQKVAYREAMDADMIAYLLAHQYSPLNLKSGIKALKGADAHMVANARRVAEDLGYMLCLL